MAVTFLSIGGLLLMPFSAVFLVKISNDSLPLIFFFSGLSTLILMPFTGKLSDRIDRYKLFVFGSLAATIMVLIYTHLGETPLWLTVLINMAVLATITCRMSSAMALNTMVAEQKDLGACMSICASLQQTASGIFMLCVYLLHKVSVGLTTSKQRIT